MKNKNVWLAYAAAWISTAAAVMKRMVNNLELEDMKMKNYELIALLMELPAGYDIKFGKTVI